MWKILLEPNTPQMTIRRTRCACWITKATGKHSEYVILIMLHDKNGYANAPQHCIYTYITCLFFLTFCWPCISVYLSQYLTNLMHKNLFYNKFYFMPLHVSSTCARHQEVRIALHSLWYHHIYRCDDTRGCVMQLWPSDDEHVCLKHVEAWNKTYKTNFVQVG
jgi:hypothetical protein